MEGALHAEEELLIFSDGASRGNPGPACYAYIFVQAGVILHEGCGYIGEATNNVAEYQAILHGLAEAARKGCERVMVYSDSELVVRQITGSYSIRKKHLKELFTQVNALSRQFDKVSFQNVPRTDRYLQRVDALCNRCLDEHRGWSQGRGDAG